MDQELPQKRKKNNNNKIICTLALIASSMKPKSRSHYAQICAMIFMQGNS